MIDPDYNSPEYNSQHLLWRSHLERDSVHCASVPMKGYMCARCRRLNAYESQEVKGREGAYYHYFQDDPLPDERILSKLAPEWEIKSPSAPIPREGTPMPG
jgi:hypothetical protein